MTEQPQTTPEEKQAEFHLAILGPRELYHCVAKNHSNGKVLNAWLIKDEVLSWVEQRNREGYCCWISLNDKENGNDSIKGVCALCDFWLDVDSKRSDKSKPASEAELQEALNRAAKLKEHIEITYGAVGFLANSGNGFHLHFSLPRFELVGDEFRKEVNAKVTAFAKKVSAKIGAEIDHTYDIRRVTTLIGSLNLKIPDQPLVTCWDKNIFVKGLNRTLLVEDARKLNHSLLEAILNEETEETAKATDQETTKPHLELTAILKAEPTLNDIYNGEYKKYNFKSRSEAECSLIVALVCYGFTASEIRGVMENSKVGKWNDKETREDYRERTLTKAFNFVEKEKLKPKQIERQPKPNEKNKPVMKDSGQVADGCFEAIYHNEQPFFLMKNSEDFSIVESVEVNGEEFIPKDVRRIPYEPYGYFEGSIPNMEELFWKVRSEIDMFIDVEPIWKDILAVCVLLSYHQEKFQTVPYIFLYGDNESGKSTVLQILKSLCYRPMYGVTIPSADLYGYLEDSDSIGVILEDEVQGIEDDTDKIKIYKAGYKQGAVVPRMIMTEHDRIIKYYQTFCFKVCASEQIPRVKGFRERFIEVPMVEGYPQKEWADVTKEDLERLRELRNTLLEWRMSARTRELPNVEVPVKGRVKELWKPLLQVAHGLPVYDTLFKVVEEQRKERLSAKQDTLEGHIVKVITEIFNEAEEPTEPIPFSTIWNALVLDLNGKVDDKKPNIMDTSEFFDVSKNKVGYRLREVLSGKTKVLKEKVGDDWVSFKAYEFNLEKLWRVSKKYGYEFSTKLLSLLSSEGAQAPKVAQKAEKTGKSDVENGEKKAESATKETRTPQELGTLGNLVEKPTYVYKHVKPAEPCELCGQLAVEWEITAPDGSVIRRCNACFVKMQARFTFKEESKP
jgi:hypothetical protein